MPIPSRTFRSFYDAFRAIRYRGEFAAECGKKLSLLFCFGFRTKGRALSCLIAQLCQMRFHILRFPAVPCLPLSVTISGCHEAPKAKSASIAMKVEGRLGWRPLSYQAKSAMSPCCPIGELAARPAEVRLTGYNGRDLLTLSSSHFDPVRTCENLDPDSVPAVVPADRTHRRDRC